MLPETITLETERLLLKEITPELYIHVFENSTDEEIKAYFDFDGKGFELAKSRYKKGMTNYHTTKFKVTVNWVPDIVHDYIGTVINHISYLFV